MVAIIEHIVEQHAEEAAFLWLMRDSAADAPHYDAHDLARLDARIEAHLDGLRVAGPAGHEIVAGELERHPEAGEVFAAGVLALESGKEDAVDTVVAVCESAPEARRGLISAFGWVGPGYLGGTVRAFLDSDEAQRRLLGVAACSLHRADPTRIHLLHDDAAAVRARTLRLMGEIGRADLLAELTAAIREDEDAGCRFWAAWSAALIGDRDSALAVLMREAEGGGRHKWRALDLALRVMTRADANSWMRGLNADPAHARLAMVACGVLGDPVAVPWLIEQMATPALARVAGESISLITGVDIAYHNLDTDAPEDFETGPTVDPANERVALDADQDLPWPDALTMRDWWEANGGKFPAGGRILLGRPLDQAACQYALDTGRQRQRRAAAHELALTTPDEKLFNWRNHPRT